MSSKDRILQAIKQNQPASLPLPAEVDFWYDEGDITERFIRVSETSGSRVEKVNSYEEVLAYLQDRFGGNQRWVTTLPELTPAAAMLDDTDAHLLENVDLAIINAHLGVAENGALWTTEHTSGVRVLPFICQHLAIVLPAGKLVPLMQQAYEMIGDSEYGYAAFISGPSKTADIEQSLVIGAHGPRSLTVFLLNDSLV